MLAFYLAHLHEHGGPEVNGAVVGLYAALFYLAELVLSPLFGILSDRIGHHKVMLYGPVFGAVAVLITAVTTNLVLLGGTRILEGASGAASVPSILGFIAMATAGNEVLRGKTSARFEAATLAGLGAGAIVGVKLFEIVGPVAFLFNAVLYGVSFLIYRFGVSDPAGEKAAVAGEHVRVSRYLDLIRTSHVWLLAPTWIAVNAAIGVWLSQSVFQLAKGNPKFPDQLLMGGFTANQITIGALVIAAVFGAGLIYWGNRFKTLPPDHDHRLRRARRGRPRGGRHRRQPPRAQPAGRRPDRRAGRRRWPVPAGRRDAGRPRAARRHVGALPVATAARSWASTRSSSRSARSSAA